jgi:predicted AAA+ superfamily ATPase
MRYLFPVILKLLAEERKMVFVAGPRQVGKTTLAKACLEAERSPQAYFNWDVDTHRKRILRNPETFWQSAAPAERTTLIALDEIHKYPRWKRFLKGLFDAGPSRVKILVTGSGRLDVYQRGGDSLLGRYSLLHLHPFTVGELSAADRASLRSPDDLERGIQMAAFQGPELESALDRIERFTGFPEPLFASQEAKLLRWRRSRNHLVLREDLRDLTRIRELGLIEALVELLPERVGSPLSLNALREDLGVAFGTVEGWMNALERLYYAFELRPYAGKMARTLRREAKAYLFDGSAIKSPGARFENLVALHLAKARDAWNDLGQGDFALHYVRDKEKREVDFLVTRGQRPYLLVETKLSDEAPSPALKYFHERLRPRLSLQLIRHAPPGFLETHPDGIHCLAASRFLALLP